MVNVLLSACTCSLKYVLLLGTNGLFSILSDSVEYIRLLFAHASKPNNNNKKYSAILSSL